MKRAYFFLLTFLFLLSVTIFTKYPAMAQDLAVTNGGPVSESSGCLPSVGSKVGETGATIGVVVQPVNSKSPPTANRININFFMA